VALLSGDIHLAELSLLTCGSGEGSGGGLDHYFEPSTAAADGLGTQATSAAPSAAGADADTNAGAGAGAAGADAAGAGAGRWAIWELTSSGMTHSWGAKGIHGSGVPAWAARLRAFLSDVFPFPHTVEIYDGLNFGEVRSKNAWLGATFGSKNSQFTKTGSGQTQGNLKRAAFFAGGS
jgi:hypothetical protein